MISFNKKEIESLSFGGQQNKNKDEPNRKESLNWFGSEGCVDRIPSVTGAAPTQLCRWPHHKELKLILEIFFSLSFVFGICSTNN